MQGVPTLAVSAVSAAVQEAIALSSLAHSRALLSPRKLSRVHSSVWEEASVRTPVQSHLSRRQRVSAVSRDGGEAV